MLLPKKQNKKNYKSLSGIYLKSRHESPANSSDKSESVNCAKALQYARLPGSLTVEAAFVVPWIILAAIVLCSLFSVLRGELYMSAALHNAARIMAAEVTEIEHKENISDDVPADTNTTDIIDIVKNEKAGITDSESKAVEKYGVSENSVAGNIVSHIRLRYLVQKELRGMGWKEEENSGMISEISFRDSNFSGDEIIACVSYQICMPVSFGHWGNLPVKHQVVCKKWTGRKEHGSGTGDSEYVFVTPYGTAYKIATEVMNNTNTNSGGWASSQMRSSTMTDYYNKLPEATRKVIGPVQKITGTSGGRNQTTGDSVFLLSGKEVFGGTGNGNGSYCTASEASATFQYQYFANIATTTASRAIHGNYGWWLRSPYCNNCNEFCSVYAGRSGNASANVWYDVFVAFCIY